MRVPAGEHRARRWRIDEIAPDFRLEDAWALPAHGGAGDFATLLEVVGSLNPADGASAATRLLIGIRNRVGELLGWDHADAQLAIPGDAETTLQARLPEDLRGSAADIGLRGFTPLYSTDDEWAAELSNRTVHAVMQLVWIDRGEGRYQGELGIYVKPRGLLGAAYMAAIAPFRHHIVYPALIREIERAWDARMARR